MKMLCKLGRKEMRLDARTFKVEDYIQAVPAAPPVVDWTKSVPAYGMLCNDKLSCCVIAGMMHLAMQQRAAAGLRVVMPTQAEVIAAYSAIGGYVPGDPGTDNGCVMLDAMNYWRKNGLVFGGVKHVITAFASVKLHQEPLEASAVWLFGGGLDGLDLPVAAQGASDWKTPPNLRGRNAPGSWGGHCVDVAGVNTPGRFLKPVTWGATMPEDQGFREVYCVESYVVFTPEWIEANLSAPCGFNADQLMQDLKAL